MQNDAINLVKHRSYSALSECLIIRKCNNTTGPITVLILVMNLVMSDFHTRLEAGHFNSVCQ